MKRIATYSLLIVFLSAVSFAETPADVISPTKEVWAEAAAQLPVNWLPIVRARQLPMIHISPEVNPNVYELRYFPDAKKTVSNWRVDLASIISTYNAVFTSQKSPTVSVTSAFNFGGWSTPSGRQTYYFKLQWTFITQTSASTTVIGFGQSPGASIWSSGPGKYIHDMNYAFARSLLVLAMHLHKEMNPPIGKGESHATTKTTRTTQANHSTVEASVPR